MTNASQRGRPNSGLLICAAAAMLSCICAAAPVSAQSSGSIILDTSAYERSACLSVNEVLPLDTTPPGMVIVIQ